MMIAQNGTVHVAVSASWDDESPTIYEGPSNEAGKVLKHGVYNATAYDGDATLDLMLIVSEDGSVAYDVGNQHCHDR